MKKIISIIALLTVASVNVFAQEGKSDNSRNLMGMRYIILAGTNWSEVSLKFNGRRYSFDNSVFGWQVGGGAEIPLSQVFLGKKDFYIGANPAARFISKGGEYGIFGWGAEVTTYYVEVPVPISFGTFFGESKNFGVRVELGPYMAVGLFGSTDGLTDNDPFEYLSRLDFGITYGVAIQFLGDFYFGIHQSNGFTKDDISTLSWDLGWKF